MSLFVNLQSLSCVNFCASQSIPAFYLIDGDAIFTGDSRQGFSVAYPVVGYIALLRTFSFAAACFAAGIGHGNGSAVFKQLCAAMGINRVLFVNKSTNGIYR